MKVSDLTFMTEKLKEYRLAVATIANLDKLEPGTNIMSVTSVYGDDAIKHEVESLAQEMTAKYISKVRAVYAATAAQALCDLQAAGLDCDELEPIPSEPNQTFVRLKSKEQPRKGQKALRIGPTDGFGTIDTTGIVAQPALGHSGLMVGNDMGNATWTSNATSAVTLELTTNSDNPDPHV